jgi:hypothetical protein
MAGTDPNGDRGPWRVVILDTTPDDPKWLLATITMPSDVRPARLDGAGRYLDWDEAVKWVSAQVGWPVRLVPVSAVAWRVDEGRQT